MLGYGIKETTTTTGIGTLSLSAVTGFSRFSNVFPVGTSVLYSLLDSSGQILESGIGTVAAGNTLSRDKISATLQSGTYNDLTPTAVSLTGTTTVICTGTAGAFATAIPNINTVIITSGQPPQRVVMDTRVNMNSASSTGFTMAANMLYLIPFKLDFDVIGSGISLRIGTGAAGKSIIAGLYQIDHRGYPAKLLGQTASTAAVTSGVNWSASFSSGNVKLIPGYYVIGIVSDGTPAIGAVTGQVYFNNFGVATGQNIITVTPMLSSTYTYGALPEPAPTTAAIGAATFICAGITIV